MARGLRHEAAACALLWGCAARAPVVPDECNAVPEADPASGETQAATPVPAAAEQAPEIGKPRLLSTKSGHSLLAINPQQTPYKINVPSKCARNGQDYVSFISICVSAEGTVSSIKLLKPSVPLVDRQIPEVIPRWRYRPYLVDGQPTPFCYNLKYLIRGGRERTGWLF